MKTTFGKIKIGQKFLYKGIVWRKNRGHFALTQKQIDADNAAVGEPFDLKTEVDDMNNPRLFTKVVNDCNQCPNCMSDGGDDFSVFGEGYFCKLLGEKNGYIRDLTKVLENCPLPLSGN